MATLFHELKSSLLAILVSPFVLYMFVKLKAGYPDENIEDFRSSYAAALAEPRSIASWCAEGIFDLIGAGSIAYGYVNDDPFCYAIGAMIAFGMIVELLWRAEVRA